MSNEPTKCPKCGADRREPPNKYVEIFYERKSYIGVSGALLESPLCLRRQFSEALHLLKRAKRNLLAEGDFESDCFVDIDEFLEKYK